MRDLSDRLEEQVLVLRCQAGDEQAFEAIVARYRVRLRYYLLKLIGSPDAADDVLQDVWLDVYRGLARLRDPAAFRTWIYRIARDRAFRLIRRTRPERRLIEASRVRAGTHLSLRCKSYSAHRNSSPNHSVLPPQSSSYSPNLT